MKEAINLELKKEIRLFYAVTVCITWIFWTPALLVKTLGMNFPLSADLLITAGTFVPSTVGILFTWRFGDRSDLRTLFKSIISLRLGRRWPLLLILPSVSAAAALILHLAGYPLPAPQFEALFIPVAFFYILVFMGPLGEEAGWRGFALKRLLTIHLPLKAAIRLGIVWSAWHLPLFFITGTTQHALTSFGTITALLAYTLYTVCISLLITLIYIRTGGSLAASILMHTAANFSLGYIPIIFSMKPAALLLGILCLTTILLVISFRAVFLSSPERT